MRRTFGRPALRRGFTLVELLMVMFIIALLAGLLMAGVQSAWGAVTRARVLTELNQIETALGAYKSEKGEYPPGLAGAWGSANTVDGFTRSTQLTMHLRKAFPRYLGAAAQVSNNTNIAVRNVTQSGTNAPTHGTRNVTLQNLDPAEAYLFFLNGLPVFVNGQPRSFDGFSADPTDPLKCLPDLSNASNVIGRNRIPPKLEVDPARLVDRDNDGWPELLPADKATAPIVCFISGYYLAAANTPAQYPNTTNFSNHSAATLTTIGRARPYALRMPGTVATNSVAQDNEAWQKATGVQLIASGLDSNYGTDTGNSPFYRIFPKGSLSAGDFDNLTNFHGGNLGSGQ